MEHPNRQHLRNITTGDLVKYIKRYVGWDGKGAMFPKKGRADTVVTGTDIIVCQS